ncbi:hypothetical protein PMAYCL1PPCAC_15361 [Pristionchus mayeri]|uniref:Uncharacterized protein n=1 Tax=Pristionchus mayeri TaxID=1317129 RepID=A0AAN5HYI3_9BILA|nr:hypothetical protein PMAYCL1PPCAC_15361 [Pristionchus mayeri]
MSGGHRPMAMPYPASDRTMQEDERWRPGEEGRTVRHRPCTPYRPVAKMGRGGRVQVKRPPASSVAVAPSARPTASARMSTPSNAGRSPFEGRVEERGERMPKLERQDTMLQSPHTDANPGGYFVIYGYSPASINANTGLMEPALTQPLPQGAQLSYVPPALAVLNAMGEGAPQLAASLLLPTTAAASGVDPAFGFASTMLAAMTPPHIKSEATSNTRVKREEQEEEQEEMMGEDEEREGANPPCESSTDNDEEMEERKGSIRKMPSSIDSSSMTSHRSTARSLHAPRSRAGSHASWMEDDRARTPSPSSAAAFTPPVLTHQKTKMNGRPRNIITLSSQVPMKGRTMKKDQMEQTMRVKVEEEVQEKKMEKTEVKREVEEEEEGEILLDSLLQIVHPKKEKEAKEAAVAPTNAQTGGTSTMATGKGPVKEEPLSEEPGSPSSKEREEGRQIEAAHASSSSSTMPMTTMAVKKEVSQPVIKSNNEDATKGETAAAKTSNDEGTTAMKKIVVKNEVSSPIQMKEETAVEPPKEPLTGRRILADQQVPEANMNGENGQKDRENAAIAPSTDGSRPSLTSAVVKKEATANEEEEKGQTPPLPKRRGKPKGTKNKILVEIPAEERRPVRASTRLATLKREALVASKAAPKAPQQGVKADDVKEDLLKFYVKNVVNSPTPNKINRNDACVTALQKIGVNDK